MKWPVSSPEVSPIKNLWKKGCCHWKNIEDLYLLRRTLIQKMKTQEIIQNVFVLGLMSPEEDTCSSCSNFQSIKQKSIILKQVFKKNRETKLFQELILQNFYVNLDMCFLFVLRSIFCHAQVKKSQVHPKPFRLAVTSVQLVLQNTCIYHCSIVLYPVFPIPILYYNKKCP